MKRKMTGAMNHIEDDLLEDAMKEQGRNEKRRNDMKKNIAKWASLVAVLAVILTSVIVIGVNANSGAVIAFDVNPSLEIEVNSKEEIVEVRALNEDAKKVLGDMELKGVKLDVAVNAIIGSMLTEGYLTVDQNSILVSVDTRNGKKSESLQLEIASKISALLESKEIIASVWTQSYKKTGDNGDVSEAKKTLVSKIISAGLKDANGLSYTFETLAALSVNELKLILDAKGLKVDGLTSSGSASLGGRITREEAVAIALQDAGLEKSQVTRLEAELDFEDDYFALVYEVEFASGGNKYDYEILAKGGSIASKHVGADNGTDDDDNITLPEGAITADEAFEKALTHAGISRSDAKDVDIEAEKENGAYVYEVSFEKGLFEYEYIIDAMTGEILHSEKEFG